jgi:hypothetical protein
VQILAGDTPQGFFPEHVDGELFQAIAGTSMSSPHVAGAAGAATTFDIGLDKSTLAPGAVANATLQLRSKSGTLHLPITAVGPLALPNLVITAGSASSPVTAGGPISLSRTVFNAGNANAGRFFTSFFVSTDTSFSLDDAFFASCNSTGGLGAGLPETCSGTITFNPNKPVSPGTYHVLIVADSSEEVVEGNEGDNVFVVPTTVTVN